MLVHLAEHVGGLPVVAGNSISLMSDTDVVIDRLVADIDAARHHVHLLFYIFQDDAVGRRVAKALARAAAARRGVPRAGRRRRLAAALPPLGAVVAAARRADSARSCRPRSGGCLSPGSICATIASWR